jgi:hypothetical protein
LKKSDDLKGAENVTVTLELYNEKTFILSEASTEGTIKIRFEGKKEELVNG